MHSVPIVPHGEGKICWKFPQGDIVRYVDTCTYRSLLTPSVWFETPGIITILFFQCMGTVMKFVFWTHFLLSRSYLFLLDLLF